MSIENEFLTVDLVADAGTATSRVDAFALSIIKAERQIRRLFTHIVFQCPAFGSAEVSDLRNSCPRSAQSVTNWRAAQGRLPSKQKCRRQSPAI
ncbi:hypothetical protein [Achromobacter marplatensis]|uniref:hypothetical protein n=1 Tax=Achromobacter marplatensis TaxID=470868 RepID=UPI0028EA7AE1|nr:hypothetical protein [Achromobacter marplatensis]